jgi:hypothetical protein
LENIELGDIILSINGLSSKFILRRKYMSRSHRDIHRTNRNRPEPIWWTSFRSRERTCLYKECHNEEYGDVTFPFKNIDGFWYRDDWHFSYPSIHHIRKEFYTEIQYILNNFADKHHYYYDDYLKEYNIARIGTHSFHDRYGYFDRYRWVHLKKIREVIKEWQGNPVDVLYYLIENNTIEQALRRFHHYIYNENR